MYEQHGIKNADAIHFVLTLMNAEIHLAISDQGKTFDPALCGAG